MATELATPTLCEISYDDSDHMLTPYRYQLWQSPPKNTAHSSGQGPDTDALRQVGDRSPDTLTTTFSLPPSNYTSSYLDYLRTLYECKTSCSSKSPKTPRCSHRNSVGYQNKQSQNVSTAYGCSNNRPKTAFVPHTQPLEPQQQYSLPALHHGRAWGAEDEGVNEEGDRRPSDERLVWVDALRRWIPEHQLQKPAYLSFVVTPPLVEKLYATFKEAQGREPMECIHCTKCERHKIHMEQHRQSTKCGLCGLYHHKDLPPDHVHTHRLVTLKKREALRKRANEAAAERKQRKAYSSPLYSSIKDKRQKVQFQPIDSIRKSGAGSPQDGNNLDLRVTLSKDGLESNGQMEDGQTDDTEDVTEASTDESPQSGTDDRGGSTESSDQIDQDSWREDEYVIISRSDIDHANAAMEAAEAAAEHQELLKKFQEVRRQQEREKAAKLAAAIAMETARKEEEEKLINKGASRASRLRKHTTTAATTTESGLPAGHLGHLGGQFGGQSGGKTLGQSRSKVPENKKSSVSLSSSSSNNQLKTSSSKVKASRSSSRTSHTKLDRKSSTKVSTKSSKESTIPEANDVIKRSKMASPSPPIVKQRPKIVIILPEEEIEEVDVPRSPEVKQGNGKSTTGKSKVTKEKDSKNSHPLELPPMDMSLAKPQPIAFLQTDCERGEDTSKALTQPIPTVGDAHTGPLSLAVDERPASRGQSPSNRRRYAIVKKDPGEHRRVGKKAVDEPEALVHVDPPSKRTGSWIYGDDDDDDSIEAIKDSHTEEEDNVPPLPVDVAPPLPDPDSVDKDEPKPIDTERRTVIQPPVIQKLEKKLKRRKVAKDTSYEDELRRQELAEVRRQRHMDLMEKARSLKQRAGDSWDGDKDGPNFEDYGFLAKYCIFSKANVEMFKHTFDIVDDEKRGWLDSADVMVALRAVNNKLSHAEEEYLYRILELTGYSIKNGADFKLFSVVAALSQKIAALDNWMKNMIGKMDFSMLEMKLFMCKKLWECNVDNDTNKISIDQLCVELRAGGVSLQHENEVRDKLCHLDSLDLLDFLTYIPLFIMIHQSVVDNPLDDTRDK